ncbi:MAG: AAA family ATPase [Bacteroidales bacterium]
MEHKSIISTEQKQKIAEAVRQGRTNYSKDVKYAVSLGISASQYSRAFNKGEMNKVLSDANWLSIARRLGVNLGNRRSWVTANTEVYEYITTQLEICQERGVSYMLCDLSDIGKTYAARMYARSNKNVVYVDCSQFKSKQRLIRAIAKEFGVGHTGRYVDVYEDLLFYIKILDNPMIIMDELGDLNNDALLECKALWNGVENCAFYVMGADGLEARMRRGIAHEKVGYVELFSRFGKKYGKVIPVDSADKRRMLDKTAMAIIKANSAKDADHKKILNGAMGEDGLPSLRRIENELSKL